VSVIREIALQWLKVGLLQECIQESEFHLPFIIRSQCLPNRLQILS